ncbi:MAG: amidohydrolase family protein, partial [Planctomycetota bacterium]
APQGIKFALGENVKQSNFPNSGRRFPTSRSGVEAVYRRAFTRARQYSEERDRFLAGRNPAFRRDVRLEVLADILANRIHVQCHSYRADEILMFLGICKEFGIERPTFQHVLEGYKVAPELAAYGAMGSTFSDWWAYKIEAYDAIPWNVGLMHKAGVIASINSDSGEMIRRLNTEAGKSLLYGNVPYEDALAFCTLNPARQIHMEDRLGSLEVGKDGTVTVFDAPPLSTHARCMLTLARGRTLFEHSKAHDRMWQKYAEAVKAFAQAHRESPDGEDSSPSRPPRRNQADLQRWIHSGQGHSYLIRHARVHPVSSPAFQGDVLVENGLISWTGPRWGGSLPRGCIEVDAAGQHLFPGFLDGGDQTGLYEIGSVRGTRDDSETGDFQPDLSIAAAIHAASSHIRVQRMTGITSVLVHGQRGRVTGQAALIHLDGEVTPDLIVVPDLALHIRFPNVAAPGEGKDPKDPDALEDLDRKFDQALAQGEILEHCRETGEDPPETDLKLEALLPYARGEKRVLIQTGNFLTLMRAHRWAKERGLSAVFLGCPEAWKGAGILGADGSRVLVGPIHRLPRNPSDPYDAPFREAGILAAAGCQVGLCTENPQTTRNLPFQAATAAAHGWGSDQALEGITLGAARVLGVDDLVGSIEPGKVADLFLSTGDPLDFQSRVTRMWIGGREVELASRQTDLRDRYEARIDRKKREAAGREISTR